MTPTPPRVKRGSHFFRNYFPGHSARSRPLSAACARSEHDRLRHQRRNRPRGRLADDRQRIFRRVGVRRQHLRRRHRLADRRRDMGAVQTLGVHRVDPVRAFQRDRNDRDAGLLGDQGKAFFRRLQRSRIGPLAFREDAQHMTGLQFVHRLPDRPPVRRAALDREMRPWL